MQREIHGKGTSGTRKFPLWVFRAGPQICWWSSVPLGTGRGSEASAGGGGVLGLCFVPPLGLPGLMEDGGEEGRRAGTMGGLREEPAGQSNPGSASRAQPRWVLEKHPALSLKPADTRS